MPSNALPSGFTLVRQLGRGGMGTVVEAWDTELKRRVAIKSQQLGTRDLERRLRLEARALAALNHANIVRVHDVRREGETLFLILELVDGESLAAAIARGPIPEEEATRIARDVGRALAAAHAAGILHRDVKPGNVLLGTDGRVRLADFGIAVATFSLTGGTSSGEVLGTPSYMAPEQLSGEAVDERADLFSVGATLCAMLQGRLRPSEESWRAPYPKSSLGKVITGCLQRDPADRYAGAAELVADLERVLAGQRPLGTRRSWWRRLRWGWAIAGVLAPAALAGWLLPGAAPTPEEPAREPVESPSESGPDPTPTPNADALGVRWFKRDVVDARFVSETTILMRCSPSTVLLWDLDAGREVRSWTVDSESAWAVSPRGDQFAVCSEKGVTVFRVGAEGPRWTWTDASVRGCAFTPDGERLVAFGETGRVFDVQTQAWTPIGEPTPDGRRSVLVLDERVVVTWSAHLGGQVFRAQENLPRLEVWPLDGGPKLGSCRLPGGITSLTRVGDRLAVGGTGGALSLIDLETYTLTALAEPSLSPFSPMAHTGRVATVLALDDEALLTSSDSTSERTNDVAIWDLRTGKVRSRHHPSTRRRYVRVDRAPGGKRTLLLTRDVEGRVRLQWGSLRGILGLSR